MHNLSTPAPAAIPGIKYKRIIKGPGCIIPKTTSAKIKTKMNPEIRLKTTISMPVMMLTIVRSLSG